MFENKFQAAVNEAELPDDSSSSCSEESLMSDIAELESDRIEPSSSRDGCKCKGSCKRSCSCKQRNEYCKDSTCACSKEMCDRRQSTICRKAKEPRKVKDIGSIGETREKRCNIAYQQVKVRKTFLHHQFDLKYFRQSGLHAPNTEEDLGLYYNNTVLSYIFLFETELN